MLAAITSHITDDPNALHLRCGDFAEGGLPKASIVKTTNLFTMHSSLIAKRIAVLRIEKMEEVLRSLRGFFSWPGACPSGGRPHLRSPHGLCGSQRRVLAKPLAAVSGGPETSWMSLERLGQ